MKIPEIRINFSDLLCYRESQILAGDNELRSYEGYINYANLYRAEWKKYETKIVNALTEALGVNFYKPVIDVSLAPYFVPKSDPLIISYYNEPDQFVDVLMHELCHVLLTDNNVVRIRDEKPTMQLAEVWKKLFGDRELNDLFHIPVHALSKFIYCDILKEPSRLKRDIDTVKTFEGTESYVSAWDYVEKNGYKEIIAKLKKSYEVAT